MTRRKSQEQWLADRRQRWAEAFELVERGEARSQVVEVVELVKQGMGIPQIADELGIARSTVGQRLNDPTDEKNRARKAAHGGVCADCGGPTAYGKGGPANRCLACVARQNVERDEQILALWNAGMAEKEIANRLDLRPAQVRGAVDQARQKNGRYVALHRLRNREAWPEIKRRWNGGASVDSIARALGVSKQSVWNMLATMRENGIDVPPRQRARRDPGRFIELWRGGVSVKDIAAELDLTVTQVYNWAQRLRAKGVDLPKRSRWQVPA